MKAPLIFCLMLIPALVSSQQPHQTAIVDKKVICGEFDKLIEKISEYREEPVWIGADQSSDTRYTLMINEKTGSWTILQYTHDVGCILGAGEKHQTVGLFNKT